MNSHPTQRRHGRRAAATTPASQQTAPASRLRAASMAILIRGALLGVSAGAVVPSMVMAQNAAPEHKLYNLPAGTLEDSLNRFSRQAGITLSFSPVLVQGQTAPALQGNFSVTAGLATLLGRSGLQAVRAADGSYGLQRSTDISAGLSSNAASTLPQVVVVGQSDTESATGQVRGYLARRSITASKTDTPLVEIPQSISVITRDRMEEQGVQSVNEALRYVAGVSSYGANNRSDWYTAIRGLFPTMYKDGLQLPTTVNLASWMIDPYQLERVEVMRGPASVLYGQGDPGGVVNMVSKRPTTQPVHEIQVQLGSDARKQIGLDLGGPLDAGGEFSYRLTALAKEQNIHDNPGTDQRQMLAPSLTWRPDGDTSFTLLASYLHDKIDAPDDNFYPAVGTILPNPNGPIQRNVYTGDKNFVKYEKKQYSLGYEFEKRFSDTWKFRQNLSYSDLTLDNNMLYGVGFQAGSLTTIDRAAEIARFKYNRWALDNQLQADFMTGQLSHKVLVGLDYQLQNTFTSETEGTVAPLNLYNPVYTPVDLSTFTGYAVSTERMQQIGVYLQDQIKYDEHWVLTLNARRDRTTLEHIDVLGSSNNMQKDNATTGRAGLVYLADNGLSPYISYATSFNPVTGYGLDPNGNQFKPSRGRQIEAGIKYQPDNSGSSITAAIFQINQTNVMTYASNNSWKQTGEIRSRGIELEALAQINKRFKLIASYTRQDVKNVKAEDNSLDHWPTSIPVPAQMASLWADYTFGAGFSMAGGVRYVGANYGSADNSLTIPAYTVFDAAAHYDLGRWRYALNVSNLFNKEFISGCYNDTRCIYGNPRTARLTATYRW